MNNQSIYNSIINRAKNRLLPSTIMVEKHHIIPKCMGGSNHNDNLVKLTLREHFLAHWLLHKIYPTNFKLLCAWNAFSMIGCNGQRKTSHLYEYARREWIATLKNQKITNPEAYDRYIKSSVGTLWMNDGTNSIRIKLDKVDEYLNKNYKKGRITFKRKSHSKEHKEKISNKFKQRLSTGWVNPLKGNQISSEAQLNGIKQMVETRLKNGTYKYTKEERDIIEENRKLRIETNKFATCQHCGFYGNRAAMLRWHFDNCKRKEK